MMGNGDLISECNKFLSRYFTQCVFSAQAVQQVISNLLISHIELRSEDSPDVQTHVHQRSLEKIVVPLGESLTRYQTQYLQVRHVMRGYDVRSG